MGKRALSNAWRRGSWPGAGRATSTVSQLTGAQLTSVPGCRAIGLVRERGATLVSRRRASPPAGHGKLLALAVTSRTAAKCPARARRPMSVSCSYGDASMGAYLIHRPVRGAGEVRLSG